MLKDDTLRDLPENEELAFLKLEADFRKTCEGDLENLEESWQRELIYQKYVNHTVAAADALDIHDVRVWAENGRNAWENYAELTQIVDRLRVRVAIESSRRDRRYSVALNESDRLKIASLVSQIRQELESFELTDEKREALLNKLAAFEAELARPRTKLEVFAALSIAVATFTDSVSETMVRKVERIGRALGLAKDRDAENPSLPAPNETKRIEPPAKRLPAPKRRPLDDDEIPF